MNEILILCENTTLYYPKRIREKHIQKMNEQRKILTDTH